ncbi:cobyrinate a,c-diamide synthase [uncultured Corynebacterium sp.]|uniref:cobyrinate a,c-diamide synthase n=1 Tax=uncultured Corynebacterium sp. TaxID=159447 RepID=UPI0025EA0B72|nr:cobyrinate a,c-diamide synthase [uncultured Corynebacterium sp.]
MVADVPGGVIIAAPASGTGKTTIATGLVAALARRMSVAPFKVGPDYIDPGYHALAAGHPGRNLDSVMCGTGLVGPLYAHGAAGHDLGVVEGVMGLFDGRIGGDPLDAAASTAEIARILGMPVILVVDARHMSQSAAALVHGFATMDDRVHVAGAIVNRVGSDRHEAVVRDAIEAVGVPVLGAIPRVDGIEVPSRHLGLVTAAEGGAAARTAVAMMADLVEEHVDVDAVVELAGVRQGFAPWDPGKALGVEGEAPPQDGPHIALAGGPAFTFAYAEHAELLAAAGARVEVFDPLVDDLPDAGGLVVPGGFPEEHAADLAARDDLAAAVRAMIADGAAVHAECAGLLWLLESLDGHRMCGVIPGSASMGRLSLGYRTATMLSPSALGDVGGRVVGHEFHRTRLDDGAEARARAAGWTPAWGWHGWDGAAVSEGFVSPDGRVHASYLHVHPAGAPEMMRRFVGSCG